MSLRGGYAVALNEGRDATIDAVARLAQDRHLHLQDVAQLYAIALSVGASQPCIQALEGALAERSIYNDRKLITDAGVITHHEQRIGGMDMRDGKAVRYAATRACRLCDDANDKLQRDRELHDHELQLIKHKCAGNAALSTAVDAMIDLRHDNNRRRRAHDVASKDETVARMARALGI